MRQIGVRALKNEASDILRQVREDQAEYVVTHRGRPIAVILPVADAEERAQPPSPELLEALAELRARVIREWVSDETGLAILDSQRR